MSLKTQNLDLRRRLDECEEPREAGFSDDTEGTHAASPVVQDLSGDSRDKFLESWVNESWVPESWVPDPSDLSKFSLADAESEWKEARAALDHRESLHLPLQAPVTRLQSSVPGPPGAGEVVFAAAEAPPGRREQRQGNVSGTHGASGQVLISSEVMYRDRAAFSAAAAEAKRGCGGVRNITPAFRSIRLDAAGAAAARQPHSARSHAAAWSSPAGPHCSPLSRRHLDSPCSTRPSPLTSSQIETIKAQVLRRRRTEEPRVNESGASSVLSFQAKRSELLRSVYSNRSV